MNEQQELLLRKNNMYTGGSTPGWYTLVIIPVNQII